MASTTAAGTSPWAIGSDRWPPCAPLAPGRSAASRSRRGKPSNPRLAGPLPEHVPLVFVEIGGIVDHGETPEAQQRIDLRCGQVLHAPLAGDTVRSDEAVLESTRTVVPLDDPDDLPGRDGTGLEKASAPPSAAEDRRPDESQRGSSDDEDDSILVDALAQKLNTPGTRQTQPGDQRDRPDDDLPPLMARLGSRRFATH